MTDSNEKGRKCTGSRCVGAVRVPRPNTYRWTDKHLRIFFINMGVRNSLRAPLLIPWALKLMTCKPLVALRGLELVMTIEE
jgi:hypothetical protein